MRIQLPGLRPAPTQYRSGPRGLAALLLPVLLATACDAPTGLGPAFVTYVARTVNGVPIPAPLRQNANYELLVVADTLRFGLFGRATWTRVRRTTVEGIARQVEVARTEYSFHVRGDTLRFSFTCPPDADCAPSPYGVFSADRRQLVMHVQLPEAVLEYDRASP
jgi:hypothetical protein